jgi:hypothetical protein
MLLFHACFLLDLFFDPEDGGDIPKKISVEFQQTKQHYIPEDKNLLFSSLTYLLGRNKKILHP